MKRFLPLIGLILIGLVGCKDKTSTTTKSSVAQLTAFSFTANSNYPGLAAASFKVEERLDTGLVHNLDSIMYGTPLDSVVPKFTFAATPGSAIMQTPDTTIVLGGSDTINFVNQPLYLTVKSQDGTNTKVYELRAYVHRVDPDLYHWEQLCPQVLTDNSEQRVVSLGDRFVLVSNNGFRTSVYTSADGKTWSSRQTPTGLPDGCHVRRIISDGTTLYYADSLTLYTSADALSWTTADYTGKGFRIRNMLMTWNDTVWAIAEDDHGLVLANMQDGELKTTALRPKSDFPVSDFAAVCFENAAGRARAMVLGGRTKSGAVLNSRWNIEFSPVVGYRMQNFSIDRPAFTDLTGASIIWYNHQLLMFGGVDADMQYLGRDILVSNDEGLNWTAADSTKNCLPDTYTARQKQSVLVRDNAVYVFGGEQQDRTFSDVYRGKLNSIDWNN